MTHRILVGMLLLAGVLGAAARDALADHHGVHGRVVDLVEYLQQSSETAPGGGRASEGGGTLAILDHDHDTLHVIVPGPGDDAVIRRLTEHLGEEVEVVGYELTRGGVHGITPLSVEPMGEPTADDHE